MVDVAALNTDAQAMADVVGGDDATIATASNGRQTPSMQKVQKDQMHYSQGGVFSNPTTVDNFLVTLTSAVDGFQYAPKPGLSFPFEATVDPSADSTNWFLIQGYVNGSGVTIDLAGTGSIDDAVGVLSEVVNIEKDANLQTAVVIPTLRFNDLDTTVTAADIVGIIEWLTKDASDPDSIGAFVHVVADDGGLSFHLSFGTASGAGDAVEGMRLSQNGKLEIAEIIEFVAAAGVLLEGALFKDGGALFTVSGANEGVTLVGGGDTTRNIVRTTAGAQTDARGYSFSVSSSTGNYILQAVNDVDVFMRNLITFTHAGDVIIENTLKTDLIEEDTPSAGVTIGSDLIIQTSAGLTAFAGGGQPSATQLIAGINEISTVATAADSVKLPAAAAGLIVHIINNDSADACNVFPSSGDDIGGGVDLAVSLAAGAGITYASYDATNWRAV